MSYKSENLDINDLDALIDIISKRHFFAVMGESWQKTCMCELRGSGIGNNLSDTALLQEIKKYAAYKAENERVNPSYYPPDHSLEMGAGYPAEPDMNIMRAMARIERKVDQIEAFLKEQSRTDEMQVT